jgi:membrane associated rhomboid family serine protease
MTERPAPEHLAQLNESGPLSREAALAGLAQAAAFMASADFADAGRIYQRIIGTADPSITGAAMVGLGQALYRLNQDDAALGQWEQATRLQENDWTYAAWREVAAGRVRAQDYQGAITAYREADRRAPREDKGEIASRLGWLSKEVGDRGASGKYFAKARGDVGFSVAMGLVGLTVVVSLLADFGGSLLPAMPDLYGILALDKAGLAQGELWRLWSVTLVHAPLTQMPLHLLFNMYALYLAGPFVERLYGRVAFLALYLAAAAGGSLMSFAFGDAQYGVGASGAIFGLFGLLVAVQYVHKPMLDRQSRAFLGQMLGLVILNLILGLTLGGIDNWAHIGGLVTGFWLGVLYAPGRVPTMRSFWVKAGATPGTIVPAFGAYGNAALRVVGLVMLAALWLWLWTSGAVKWG